MKNYIDPNGNTFELEHAIDCPFCGKEPKVIFRHSKRKGRNRLSKESAYVICDRCTMYMSNSSVDGFERAATIVIKRWNTRA